MTCFAGKDQLGIHSALIIPSTSDNAQVESSTSRRNVDTYGFYTDTQGGKISNIYKPIKFMTAYFATGIMLKRHK